MHVCFDFLAAPFFMANKTYETSKKRKTKFKKKKRNTGYEVWNLSSSH